MGKLSLAPPAAIGRRVLAPFSDIDLLFITPDEPRPAALRAVEFMLYFLWDLGLKVGHATRSVADCLAEAGGDATVGTSLLDARLLAGDPALFERSRSASLPLHESGAGAYLAAKQAERDARHRRYGDSPFVVEPNIKEGRGGLRDLQTLYWMARYVFGDARDGRAGRSDGPAAGILTRPRRGCAAVVGFPVDAAIPPALCRRTRGGAADLRPAARGRRPHGLHAAWPAGRGGAVHAPLFPDRARGDTADARAGARADARGAWSAGQ